MRIYEVQRSARSRVPETPCCGVQTAWAPHDGGRQWRQAMASARRIYSGVRDKHIMAAPCSTGGAMRERHRLPRSAKSHCACNDVMELLVAERDASAAQIIR